jgi:hypothetical protein
VRSVRNSPGVDLAALEALVVLPMGRPFTRSKSTPAASAQREHSQ